MLPNVKKLLTVEKASESAWAWGFRIDVRHSNDQDESYFMKVDQARCILFLPTSANVTEMFRFRWVSTDARH